jgi:uncharacterized protein YidB (DUF937 family)
MTEAEVTSRLTTLLPRIIDTLTPRGEIPKGDPTSNRFSFLTDMHL